MSSTAGPAVQFFDPKYPSTCTYHTFIQYYKSSADYQAQRMTYAWIYPIVSGPKKGSWQLVDDSQIPNSCTTTKLTPPNEALVTILYAGGDQLLYDQLTDNTWFTMQTTVGNYYYNSATQQLEVDPKNSTVLRTAGGSLDDRFTVFTCYSACYLQDSAQSIIYGTKSYDEASNTMTIAPFNVDGTGWKPPVWQVPQMLWRVSSSQCSQKSKLGITKKELSVVYIVGGVLLILIVLWIVFRVLNKNRSLED